MEVVKDPGNNRDQVLVQMVNQYQGLLLRMCYIYLRDMELAKDATQDTFLKAYRSLDSFRGECSEKTWLIQIAMNTCRDMQRSAWFRHHDRRVTPEDLPQAILPPDDDDDLDVMCDVLQLPSKLKEVVMLYYWQNMNVNEIAHALGITHSTVSTRLKRAREKLYDVLERRLGYFYSLPFAKLSQNFPYFSLLFSKEYFPPIFRCKNNMIFTIPFRVC